MQESHEVDYHVLTPNGAILLHSDDMGKSYAEIAQARREFILARKQLVPNGCCHFCGYKVPKLALWCCSECATLYEDERKKLLEGV